MTAHRIALGLHVGKTPENSGTEARPCGKGCLWVTARGNGSSGGPGFSILQEKLEFANVM